MSLFMMLLMCFSLCFTSFATSGDNTEQNFIESLLGSSESESSESEDGENLHKDAFVMFLEMMVKGVFKSPVGEEDDNASIFNPHGMLDNSTGIIYGALEAIYGSNIYSVFVAIGIILLTIYFIMDLASKDVFTQYSGKTTIEQIIKPFVKFILSIMFVCNIKWIMFFLLALSQGAYTQVSIADISISQEYIDSTAFGSLTEAADIDSDAIVTQILKTVTYEIPDGWSGKVYELVIGNNPIMQIFNLLRVLPMIIVFLLPWLVSVVCDAMLVYVVLSRIVSIAIQGAMAPVAMADIYSEGNFRQTRSWDFIRNFTSLCFQSVIIALILQLVNIIIMIFVSKVFGAMATAEGLAKLATIGDWANLAIQMTILKVAQVGTVLGSANEAKRLFGGH